MSTIDVPENESQFRRHSDVDLQKSREELQYESYKQELLNTITRRMSTSVLHKTTSKDGNDEEKKTSQLNNTLSASTNKLKNTGQFKSFKDTISKISRRCSEINLPQSIKPLVDKEKENIVSRKPQVTVQYSASDGSNKSNKRRRMLPVPGNTVPIRRHSDIAIRQFNEVSTNENSYASQNLTARDGIADGNASFRRDSGSMPRKKLPIISNIPTRRHSDINLIRQNEEYKFDYKTKFLFPNGRYPDDYKSGPDFHDHSTENDFKNWSGERRFSDHSFNNRNSTSFYNQIDSSSYGSYNHSFENGLSRRHSDQIYNGKMLISGTSSYPIRRHSDINLGNERNYSFNEYNTNFHGPKKDDFYPSYDRDHTELNIHQSMAPSTYDDNDIINDTLAVEYSQDTNGNLNSDSLPNENSLIQTRECLTENNIPNTNEYLRRHSDISAYSSESIDNYYDHSKHRKSCVENLYTVHKNENLSESSNQRRNSYIEYPLDLRRNSNPGFQFTLHESGYSEYPLDIRRGSNAMRRDSNVEFLANQKNPFMENISKENSENSSSWTFPNMRRLSNAISQSSLLKACDKNVQSGNIGIGGMLSSMKNIVYSKLGMYNYIHKLEASSEPKCVNSNDI